MTDAPVAKKRRAAGASVVVSPLGETTDATDASGVSNSRVCKEITGAQLPQCSSGRRAGGAPAHRLQAHFSPAVARRGWQPGLITGAWSAIITYMRRLGERRGSDEYRKIAQSILNQDLP